VFVRLPGPLTTSFAVAGICVLKKRINMTMHVKGQDLSHNTTVIIDRAGG
jgi:hypothetical protein